MKTSFSTLMVKHHSAESVAFPAKIRTETGELKSHLLMSLAKGDQIVDLPEGLFDEIGRANALSIDDHYDGLMEALMETTAFKYAGWSQKYDQSRAHYGLALQAAAK